MSVNRYLPHVLLLPEDDANRKIAQGFILELSLPYSRNIQVLVEVGGWMEVLDHFQRVYQRDMDQFPKTFLILLVDFDGDKNRLNYLRTKIPDRLRDRTFVLGTLSEPEELKKEPRRSYETIGQGLAKDCRDGTDEIWSHPLLKHNAPEVFRLREHLRPILFS